MFRYGIVMGVDFYEVKFVSTGISISSINKIKELAEQKRYAEALEILDTQDLDKSINPQFLRISGEIFRKNKRYYDSRRILLKAHQMSPQGTRIISELIQLYLDLGYFTLANKYYETYLFFVSPEDTQKDFVEYSIKKANGCDVKELASILVPILERMPEDTWNFEAILLYDKLDRKDKALDESRFFLENFQDSIYTERVIAYIDDKLNVDEEFYIYPREEHQEDTDTYADLLDLEKELLEKDYLTMNPPEARIMVEADDKDGYDMKPVKEKKVKEKKPKKKKAKKSKADKETSQENADVAENDVQGEKADVNDSVSDVDTQQSDADAKTNSDAAENVDEQTAEAEEISEEERIQQEREAALERLLSKKFDADKIKESAKQLAESVKNIDTTKAKEQVKTVKNTVVDNVKKATDVLGEAVGTKSADEELVLTERQNDSEEILDGIIESVLEPPKQTVGQVVMNEELDALVPDSLEAMSTDEIADIEARKEEQERLELEALEASLRLEEEKKAKKDRTEDSSEDDSDEGSSQYEELKTKYMESLVDEDKPMDSLGFITVVHSDIDANMENDIPDTAQMLRQMIGNKEYYSEENSMGFESKESYNNHGFEVETYNETSEQKANNFVYIKQDFNSDVYKVEDIFADETILSFDDLVPEEITPMEGYVQSEDWNHISSEDTSQSFETDTDFAESDTEYFELYEESSVDELTDEESAGEELSIDELTDGELAGEESLIEEMTDTELVSEVFAVEELTGEEDLTSEDDLKHIDSMVANDVMEDDFVEDEVLASRDIATQDIESQIADDVADDVDFSTTDYAMNDVEFSEVVVSEETDEQTPAFGEQLSFEMQLENEHRSAMEKAVKERIELRTRILISDSMLQKLSVLKEMK